MSRPPRYVQTFAEADHRDVTLLGGKGAGLARLTAEGLPVPPGFIITTEACRRFIDEGVIPGDLHAQVRESLEQLEQESGRRFGGGPLPLLVSVRSGAPVSMPGMMDTILNLGLSRDAAIALARATGVTRFVVDILVRFQRMYAATALGAFDDVLDGVAERVARGAFPDDAGSAFDAVWAACAEALSEEVDRPVPTDPWEQLCGAVEAVFRSWNNRRAVTYRTHQGIPHDLGTAVVVQSMVFGNLGAPSGTGVVFTRNPVTGAPGLYGEYLEGGQGEDVVAGTADPEPVAALAPETYEELSALCERLERSHRDVLDIEYTVERARLYLLQVRSAKRTAEAAVRVAADLVTEGVPAGDALASITAEQVRQLERARFDEDAAAAARADDRLLARGTGASPGEVSGVVVIDPDRAVERAQAGEAVILVRPTTSPLDLRGMLAAQGIVTVKGGATSHAAVVARAVGKACVVGCGRIHIDEATHTLAVDGRVLAEGEALSIDGSTGEVFAGALPMTRPAASNPHLARLLEQADTQAGCRILGRVTTAEQVQAVLDRGANGIVTSVEDVLAASGDLDLVVEALDAGRGAALDLRRVRAVIAERFTDLLSAADGADVGIRTIDFRADEARELLQQTQLLDAHPGLAVPLGIPELVAAQVGGLADAVSSTGFHGRAHVAVRRISDPAEARALTAIASDEVPDGRLQVGTYVVSPRGATLSVELAVHSSVLWVEVRALQAVVFGLPPRQLLVGQPLDDYVQRGMLSTDPRIAIDPAMAQLLSAAQEADRVAGCTVGMRLSGAVADEALDSLYGLGFRLFAVDATEVRATRLALGRAAAAAAG